MKSLYNGIESPLSIVHYPLSIDSDTPPFDDSFYDAVVNELYGMGGYSPDYLTTPNGSALIGETNRVLMDGVSKGIASITEEPDPAFSAALAQNTFIFSGFKTHQELQEVNSLLRDKDGKLRPYDEFKRDVLKLNKEYNQNYLRAEYNHAVQSAQMAAKWQEFLKHKDFVNLQYRTANDERVRAEHAALHGTTLPVDDKFWTKYLPPLGWNCRCTVVEVLKDSYPESNSDEAVRAGDSATSRPAEKIFRFNPGKELKVFPPKHPYLPRESQCSGCNKDYRQLQKKGDLKNCKVCYALKCIEDQRKKAEKFVKARKKAFETVQSINNELLGLENIDSGFIYKSRKSTKNLIRHCRNEAEIEAALWAVNHLDSLEFVRSSYVGEGKDLKNPEEQRKIQKKLDNGIVKYNIYFFEYKGRRWVLKTEVYYNNNEMVYSFTKKP